MKKNLFIIFLSCVIPFLAMAQQQPITPDFTKGYIYSKIEDRFSNANIGVDIDNENIIIYSWPMNLEYEIKFYLENLCPYYRIHFNSRYQPNNSSLPYLASEDTYGDNKPFEEGGFLPEHSPFFPTMLAQPHLLGYSAGYRSYDKVFKSSLPVSIGDQFSLYQFKIHSGARLYFGIEACVFAVFEAKTKSLSLINADYYVALPLTYINDKFSARLRVFHESSHLGDEFLLEHPKIDRKNPSMEGVDLSLAYEPVDKCVIFAGYTRILRSDESFKVKPNMVYYGFNYFLNFAKIKTFDVEATPYVAAYFKNAENNNWGLDTSVALGYQWNKSYGRKLRIYVMGHDGYSAEGQFSRNKSKYVSINLLYGY
ncbi:MAG: DUF1207 domain-containing protein [Parachlamydiaceae bacterium]|nr:DUF1207 domain-containing protein [Parachlamydiaceae bacterium]